MINTMKVLTLDRVMACKANIYELELHTFNTIEPQAFEALSRFKHYLNLSGLSSISDDEAVLFAKHHGILDLSGLKELSDTAASALASKKGGLWLNGLTFVTDNAAISLSSHVGDLYLWGLTEMTKIAHQALSKQNIFLTCSKIKIIDPIVE